MTQTPQSTNANQFNATSIEELRRISVKIVPLPVKVPGKLPQQSASYYFIGEDGKCSEFSSLTLTNTSNAEIVMPFLKKVGTIEDMGQSRPAITMLLKPSSEESEAMNYYDAMHQAGFVAMTTKLSEVCGDFITFSIRTKKAPKSKRDPTIITLYELMTLTTKGLMPFDEFLEKYDGDAKTKDVLNEVVGMKTIYSITDVVDGERKDIWFLKYEDRKPSANGLEYHTYSIILPSPFDAQARGAPLPSFRIKKVPATPEQLDPRRWCLNIPEVVKQQDSKGEMIEIQAGNWVRKITDRILSKPEEPVRFVAKSTFWFSIVTASPGYAAIKVNKIGKAVHVGDYKGGNANPVVSVDDFDFEPIDVNVKATTSLSPPARSKAQTQASTSQQRKSPSSAHNSNMDDFGEEPIGEAVNV